MAAPATAAAQALQLAASLRASEALLTNKLATREEELAKLTKQAEQAQMMLRKEQSEKQGLQTKVRALEDQINELRNWQQSPTDFENDVATAIQHAKEADRSQVEELERLRREVEELRGESSELAISVSTAEARLEGPKAERARLQAENTKLEEQLKKTAAELDRFKKDLFAERVHSKRSLRELEGTRAQLKSAREEMGKLYEDLARARHELARINALAASGCGATGGANGGSRSHVAVAAAVAALAANGDVRTSNTVHTAARRASCGELPLRGDGNVDRLQEWMNAAAKSDGSNHVSHHEKAAPAAAPCSDHPRSGASERSSLLLTPTADPALLSALQLIQAHQQAAAYSPLPQPAGNDGGVDASPADELSAPPPADAMPNYTGFQGVGGIRRAPSATNRREERVERLLTASVGGRMSGGGFGGPPRGFLGSSPRRAAGSLNASYGGRGGLAPPPGAAAELPRPSTAIGSSSTLEKLHRGQRASG